MVVLTVFRHSIWSHYSDAMYFAHNYLLLWTQLVGGTVLL